MTAADKPTSRRTYSRFRSREICVTIHPTWLSFRLAGTRKAFLLDVEAAYCFAAKLEAARARAEKVKARAAARAERRK